MDLLLYFEYQDQTGEWKIDEEQVIYQNAQYRDVKAANNSALFKNLIADFYDLNESRQNKICADSSYDIHIAVRGAATTKLSASKCTYLYLDEIDEVIARHYGIMDDYLDGIKQKKKDTRRVITYDIFDDTAVEFSATQFRAPSMVEIQRYLHALKQKKSYVCSEGLLDYKAKIRVYAILGRKI